MAVAAMPTDVKLAARLRYKKTLMAALDRQQNNVSKPNGITTQDNAPPTPGSSLPSIAFEKARKGDVAKDRQHRERILIKMKDRPKQPTRPPRSRLAAHSDAGSDIEAALEVYGHHGKKKSRMGFSYVGRDRLVVDQMNKGRPSRQGREDLACHQDPRPP